MIYLQSPTFVQFGQSGHYKNSGGNFPAAVSCETLIAIKFTGHKLPAALALGLADDDAVIIIAHQLLHIKERLGEGGGDGLQLAKVGKQGQHGLFVALAVHVGVEAEGFNVGFLSVLEVLHIQTRLAGEAVQSFLVLAEVFDVSLDDGHGVFLLLKIFGVLFSTHTSRRSCRRLELVLNQMKYCGIFFFHKFKRCMKAAPC